MISNDESVTVGIRYKELILSNTCGIILAGGTGTRMHPATKAVNKHLLCLYDKPVIFYPLSTLMLAGVRDICLICTPEFEKDFQKLLGDGSEFGIRITYIRQENPNGIAEAYKLAENFIDGRRSVMILGDNIFFGDRLGEKIKSCINDLNNNYIFGYSVRDPKPFGVINHEEDFKVIDIEEKPQKPKSNLAAVGLYIFNPEAAALVHKVTPSSRNELEITDLCNLILNVFSLNVTILGRGYTWLDAGTPNDLLSAANFVATIQERQGYMIGCIHEISYKNGWLPREILASQVQRLGKTPYAEYLKNIMK